MTIIPRSKLFLLILLISVTSCRKASPGFLTVDRGFDGELTAEQEEAVAVIHLEEERMNIINSSEAYWDYRVIKRILKHGHPEEGAFKFRDGRYLEVVSIRARAIHPDGREEILTEGDIEKVPDFRQYVLYSDECSRAFRFSGIRPGTLLEVFVRRRINNLVYWPPAFFQRHLPVLRRTYVLEHPKDLRVRVQALNMDRDAYSTREIEGGRLKLVWERTDIEPFEEEEHMPPAEQYMPSLWFAVLEDQKLGKTLDLSSWEGIAEWYCGLSRESLKPGSGIVRMLNNLSVEGLIDIEKARRIYHYVQSNVRYVAIILGLGGFMPHTAEETFDKLYGDCKDQSTLLVSALREAGIESHLVLVRTADWGSFEERFSFPGYFNHVIAAAELSGRMVYVDPTCRTCSFGILPYLVQGADALVIREGEDGLVTLPVGLDGINEFDASSVISVGESGTAVVCDTLKLQGFYAERYRRAFGGRAGQSPKKTAKKLLAREYPLADVERIEIGGMDPEKALMEIVLEYTIPEFVERRRTVFIDPILRKLPVPRPMGGDRLYPFTLGKERRIISRVTVNVPEGSRITGTPGSLSIENEYFAYSGSWSGGGSSVQFTRYFELSASIVPLEDLRDIRDQVYEIEAFEDSKILIEKEEVRGK